MLVCGFVSHTQAAGNSGGVYASGSWVYVWGSNDRDTGHWIYATLTGKYGAYTQSDLLGNGTVVTNKATLKASLEAQTAALNHRLDALGGGAKMAKGNNNTYAALAGRGSQSAGSDTMNWGVWLSAAYTDFKVSDPYVGISGDIWSAALGADYRLNDMFTVGLALNYAHEDSKTTFLSEKIKSNGYGVTPYAKVVFNENFDLDIMASYMYVDTETSHQNIRWGWDFLAAGAGPVSGTLSGKPTAHQYSGRLAFNAHMNIVESVKLSGQVGADYARREQGSFTQTASFNVTRMADDRPVSKVTSEVARAFANVKVGFAVTEEIIPFIKGGYMYDLTFDKERAEYTGAHATQADIAAGASRSAIKFKKDRHNYHFGGGVVGKFDSILISAEYSHMEGARNFKSDTGMLTVRYEF